MILWTRRMIHAASVAAAAVAVVLAATGASAQPQPVEDLIKAAKAEGSLLIYSSSGEEENKYVTSRFEAKYGIKTTYIRLVANSLFQRFVAENRSQGNQADILNSSTPIFFRDHPSLFLDFDEKSIPNLKTVPEQWRGRNYFTFATSPLVIAYNTAQMKGDVPKSWPELLEPRWRGKLLLNDLREGDIYLAWIDGIEKKYGMDFVKKIASMKPNLINSGSSGAQQVAAGAYAANFPTFLMFSQGLIRKNAPVAIGFMTDMLMVSERDYAIPKAAPHPNAARLFINWLASEEVMRDACKTMTMASPRDPDGKAGCIALKNITRADFNIPKERAATLLQAVGLGAR